MRKSYFGKQSGKLTVIDNRELLTTEKALCKCVCGAEKYIKVNSVLCHKTQSCGCLYFEAMKNSDARTKNIVGKTFGRLTVVKLAPKVDGKRRKWLCLCSCGNYIEVDTSSLSSGLTRSCGCLNKELASERAMIDLSGKKFGKLSVISRSGSSGDRRVMWLCECDCGNQTITSGRRLLLGQTCSCGCIKSKAELEIKNILSRCKIEFMPQKTFPNCVYKGVLFFDVYIPSLNLCVELDGEQHDFPVEFFGGEKCFIETQLRDQIKNTYCLEHNINLLRIPYTQFHRLEEICKENKII